MKKNNLILFAALLITSIFACKKEVDEAAEQGFNADTNIKGIVAFVQNDGSPNDTLSVTFSDLKDTIYFTTKPLQIGVTPIDISKVTVEIEAYKKSEITPASPITFDLTEPKSITIKAEDGSTQTYILKAVVSEPYQIFPQFQTTITELWSKTGNDLGLNFPGTNKGMAVNGDYLVMLDNNIDKSAMAAIKLYNKLTGEFVKNINYYEGGWTDPRSYSWNLDTDETGGLAMGRLNSGGAGVMIDYWTGIDLVPSLKLNSTAAADLPANTGKRMSITGSLSTGTGYIYASAAHFYGAAKQNAEYAYWEFNNGTPVSTRPTVFTYAGASSGWYNATVQRASVTDNTLYISWVNEDGYPNDAFDTWTNLHKINFHIFTPGSTEAAKVVNSENFGYRMLDTKVFNLLDGTFMAMLEQSYSTGGTMKLNLFNLSDPTIYQTKPGDDGNDRLKIYSSNESAPTSNDGRYGHVAIGKTDEDEAIIYAYFPNPDPAAAKVVAYKLEIVKTN